MTQIYPIFDLENADNNLKQFIENKRNHFRNENLWSYIYNYKSGDSNLSLYIDALAETLFTETEIYDKIICEFYPLFIEFVTRWQKLNWKLPFSSKSGFNKADIFSKLNEESAASFCLVASRLRAAAPPVLSGLLEQTLTMFSWNFPDDISKTPAHKLSCFAESSFKILKHRYERFMDLYTVQKWPFHLLHQISLILSDEFGKQYAEIAYCIFCDKPFTGSPYDALLLKEAGEDFSLNALKRSTRTILSANLIEVLESRHIDELLFPDWLESVDAVIKVKAQPLVVTATRQRSLRDLAYCVYNQLPVLVESAPGGGKSSLISELARRLDIAEPLFVHLGDQIDAKFLLGSYTCDDEPSVFKWQPGVLTQALQLGRWVVFEEFGRASNDIISLLLSVLESRTLYIPTERRQVKAHPLFRIFATRSVFSVDQEPSFMANYLWNRLFIDSSRDDIVSILEQKYPQLGLINNQIVAIGEEMVHLVSTGSSWGLSAKHASSSLLRNSLKIADRLCSAGKFDIETVFLDAMDCFAARFADLTAVEQIAKLISGVLNLPQHRAEYYLGSYCPQLDAHETNLVVGRVQVPCYSSTVSIDNLYAPTRVSMRLLEKMAVAVTRKEPVLLVGETGTGKTTSVQFLARAVGVELVVINMSQQTESSDLLGGFKPVSILNFAQPLYAEFERLFSQTFPVQKNREYLGVVVQMLQKRKWSGFVAGIKKASAQAFSKLQGNQAKKRRTDLLEEWSAFRERFLQFEMQWKKWKNQLVFQFVEGALVDALRHGKWILFDEMNLASQDALDTLNGLLDGPDSSVLLLERGDMSIVPRHPRFRIFACMNDSTDVGKRELPVGFRVRFTEIYSHMPDLYRDDVLLVVQSNVQALGAKLRLQSQDIVSLYYDFKNAAQTKLVDGSNRQPIITLRTLSRAFQFTRSSLHIFSADKALYEGIYLFFVSNLSLESRIIGRAIVSQYFGFMAPAKPCIDSSKVVVENFPLDRFSESINDDKFVSTTSVRANLQRLSRACLTRKFPILLEGPTSSGKTSMVEYLANLTGHKFVRINNHEHTDLQEYIGSYVADSTGRLVFEEGALVKAVREGHWLVLDELNLAPTDILEALNRLLDDNRELFIPETQQVVRAHPHFILFATQNPSGLYGGRKVLSRAFRNRFVELFIDDLPENELAEIIHRRCSIAPSHAEKLVDVYRELHLQRARERLFEGRDGFITLRDLFRWANRGSVTYGELATHGYMILAERMRQAKDKVVVCKVLEKVFKVTLNVESFYLKYFEQHYSGETELIWTDSAKRLFTLVHLSMHHNEPLLLVGETGSGKTTIIETVARLLQPSYELSTISCHQGTEVSDFIGSQRPTRHGCTKSRIPFEWCDGPLVCAMKEGRVFLVDEISLAEDAVLERLNSVLEPSRLLVLAEKTDAVSGLEQLVAHKDFKIAATMNPGGDFGKKELSPALRNRFTEIWAPPLESFTDFVMLIRSKLGSLDFPQLDEFTKRLFEFLTKRQQLLNLKQLCSLRDLDSMFKFLRACWKASPFQFLLHESIRMIFIDGSPDASLVSKANLECFGSFYEGMSVSDKLEDTSDKFGIFPFYYPKKLTARASNEQLFAFDAPTTKANLKRVLCSMQLKKPILIEGNPGAGKTSLVQHLAECIGANLVRVNLSEQTDIGDLFGLDTPDENGSFVWRNGAVLEAMERGDWVLLDELNLASQSALEGLNACLDYRQSVFIPELNRSFKCHPDFMVFGAQNPVSMGGNRKGLPQSFLNRFSRIYVEALGSLDYQIVLRASFPQLSDLCVSRITAFLEKINGFLSSRSVVGGPWDVNLRDVFRWITLAKADETKLVHYFSIAIAARFRAEADYQKVQSLFCDAFDCDVGDLCGPAFNEIDSGKWTVGVASILTPSLPWRNCSELCFGNSDNVETIASCVENNVLAIVTGAARSGKSSLVRQLASLTGSNLVTVYLYASMDSTELLGGFEQVDNTSKFFQLRVIATNLAKSVDLDARILQQANAIFTLEQAQQFLGNFNSNQIPSSAVSLVNEFKRVASSVSVERSAGKFEWVDSPLVTAIENGDWVLLENVNLCSSAVIDRLNSLFENNGVLVLGEAGVSSSDGNLRVIRPHKNFRCFMTYNPSFGELSRAMRNRGIELSVKPSACKTPERFKLFDWVAQPHMCILMARLESILSSTCRTTDAVVCLLSSSSQSEMVLLKQLGSRGIVDADFLAKAQSLLDTISIKSEFPWLQSNLKSRMSFGGGCIELFQTAWLNLEYEATKSCFDGMNRNSLLGILLDTLNRSFSTQCQLKEKFDKFASLKCLSDAVSWDLEKQDALAWHFLSHMDTADIGALNERCKNIQFVLQMYEFEQRACDSEHFELWQIALKIDRHTMAPLDYVNMLATMSCSVFYSAEHGVIFKKLLSGLSESRVTESNQIFTALQRAVCLYYLQQLSPVSAVSAVSGDQEMLIKASMEAGLGSLCASQLADCRVLLWLLESNAPRQQITVWLRRIQTTVLQLVGFSGCAEPVIEAAATTFGLLNNAAVDATFASLDQSVKDFARLAETLFDFEAFDFDKSRMLHDKVLETSLESVPVKPVNLNLWSNVSVKHSIENYAFISGMAMLYSVCSAGEQCNPSSIAQFQGFMDSYKLSFLQARKASFDLMNVLNADNQYLLYAHTIKSLSQNYTVADMQESLEQFLFGNAEHVKAWTCIVEVCTNICSFVNVKEFEKENDSFWKWRAASIKDAALKSLVAIEEISSFRALLEPVRLALALVLQACTRNCPEASFEVFSLNSLYIDSAITTFSTINDCLEQYCKLQILPLRIRLSDEPKLAKRLVNIASGCVRLWIRSIKDAIENGLDETQLYFKRRVTELAEEELMLQIFPDSDIASVSNDMPALDASKFNFFASLFEYFNSDADKYDPVNLATALACSKDAVLDPLIVAYLSREHSKLSSFKTKFELSAKDRIEVANMVKNDLIVPQNIVDMSATYEDALEICDLHRALISMHADSSLQRIVASFEKLLVKLADFKHNRPADAQIDSYLQKVSKAVVFLRRKQLDVWQHLLDAEDTRYKSDALAAWPRLFCLCGAFEDDFPFSADSFFDTFISSSVPAGSFKHHLQVSKSVINFLLRYWKFSAPHIERKLQQYLLKIHASELYLPHIALYIDKKRAAVEKELKGFLRIADWKDINAYSLMETGKKNQRQLIKYVRQYRKILDTPVSAIVETMSNPGKGQQLKLGNLTFRTCELDSCWLNFASGGSTVFSNSSLTVQQVAKSLLAFSSDTISRKFKDEASKIHDWIAFLFAELASTQTSNAALLKITDKKKQQKHAKQLLAIRQRAVREGLKEMSKSLDVSRLSSSSTVSGVLSSFEAINERFFYHQGKLGSRTQLWLSRLYELLQTLISTIKSSNGVPHRLLPADIALLCMSFSLNMIKKLFALGEKILSLEQVGSKALKIVDDLSVCSTALEASCTDPIVSSSFALYELVARSLAQLDFAAHMFVKGSSECYQSFKANYENFEASKQWHKALEELLYQTDSSGCLCPRQLFNAAELNRSQQFFYSDISGKLRSATRDAFNNHGIGSVFASLAETQIADFEFNFAKEKPASGAAYSLKSLDSVLLAVQDLIKTDSLELPSIKIESFVFDHALPLNEDRSKLERAALSVLLNLTSARLSGVCEVFNVQAKLTFFVLRTCFLLWTKGFDIPDESLLEDDEEQDSAQESEQAGPSGGGVTDAAADVKDSTNELDKEDIENLTADQMLQQDEQEDHEPEVEEQEKGDAHEIGDEDIMEGARLEDVEGSGQESEDDNDREMEDEMVNDGDELGESAEQLDEKLWNPQDDLEINKSEEQVKEGNENDSRNEGEMFGKEQESLEDSKELPEDSSKNDEGLENDAELPSDMENQCFSDDNQVNERLDKEDMIGDAESFEFDENEDTGEIDESQPAEDTDAEHDDNQSIKSESVENDEAYSNGVVEDNEAFEDSMEAENPELQKDVSNQAPADEVNDTENAPIGADSVGDNRESGSCSQPSAQEDNSDGAVADEANVAEGDSNLQSKANEQPGSANQSIDNERVGASNQPESYNQSEANPKRDLAKNLQNWKTKLQMYMSKYESREAMGGEHDNGDDDMNFDERAEYGFAEADQKADAQVLDSATKEQADSQQLQQMEDDTSPELLRDDGMQEIKEEREISAELSNKDSAASKLETGTNRSAEHEAMTDADGAATDNYPIERAKQILQMLEENAPSENATGVSVNHVPSGLETAEASMEPFTSRVTEPVQNDSDVYRNVWVSVERRMDSLATVLSEQLKLILEPTLAAKLKGDYKSGKRLNMKKIIPFIASDFRKDKIWKRRTMPSDREYQILVAVDNSKSMGDTATVQLTFQALVLLVSALRKLQVGQVGVLGYGETVCLLRPIGSLSQQQSSAVDSELFANLDFKDEKTHTELMMSTALQLLGDARRQFSVKSSSSSAGELWQLQLVLSDGVMEDHAAVHALVRRAYEQKVMVIFVVLDRASEEKGITSISDMQNVSIDPQTSQLVISSYLDTFPFQYYVILQQINELPVILCDILRQYFSFTSTSS